MIISVFIPHGGCPVRCSFCDQKTSGGGAVAPAAITKHIAAHLATAEKQTLGSPLPEVAFYGATFTALSTTLQTTYLDAVLPFIEKGEVGGVRISTRPDAIDSAWLLFLKQRYRLSTVEIGAQSFNPIVLQRMGRGHSVTDVEEAIKKLKDISLTIGLHLLVGCPSEGPTDDQLNLDGVLKLRPDFVRIHPLLVFKKTALADDVMNQNFVPLDLESAIERTARLVAALEAAHIPVFRIGLQPNEVMKDELMAGPYHPAFGELVRSRIWRHRLADQLKQERIREALEITLEIPPRLVSQVRGQKNCNIQWLNNNFQLTLGGQYMIKTLGHEYHQSNSTDVLQMRIRYPAGPSECRQIHAF